MTKHTQEALCPCCRALNQVDFNPRKLPDADWQHSTRCVQCAEHFFYRLLDGEVFTMPAALQ